MSTINKDNAKYSVIKTILKHTIKTTPGTLIRIIITEANLTGTALIEDGDGGVELTTLPIGTVIGTHEFGIKCLTDITITLSAADHMIVVYV